MRLSSTKLFKHVALIVGAAMGALLSTSPTKAQAPASSGTISVIYEMGADEKTNAIAELLKGEPLFNDLAKDVGEGILLPRDMTVVFQNCDQPNAFYNPAKRELVMCYELIAQFTDSFLEESESAEELGRNVIGASIFFFYHELGHALIHQLELPTTGREEDAVDELAALIVLEGDEDGQGAMMLAATVLQFGKMADATAKEQALNFWGEHALDAQRMYSLICMIYGSNPEKYAQLVGDDGLPEARAQRCPFEYQQRKRSWDRLLENHLRPDQPQS